MAIVMLLCGCRPRNSDGATERVGVGAAERALPADSVTSKAAVPPAVKPARTAPTASDTARGIVNETGSAPLTALLLVPAGTGEAIALQGAAAELLRRVVGLDVVVRGKLTEQRAPVTPSGARVFEAADFVVRGADGVEAHDGTITFDGQSYGLRTHDGVTHRVPHLPVALRNATGARVFLVGSLEQPPVSYGTIEERK